MRRSVGRIRLLFGTRSKMSGLPVSPLVTGRTNDVFSVNERVVLSGEWSGGRMHLVAVGAAARGAAARPFPSHTSASLQSRFQASSMFEPGRSWWL